MENAIIHAVDALATSPAFLFALGAVIVAAYVAIKALPTWQECKVKQLEIEERRENRKAEEARMRDEQAKQAAISAARYADALDRNTDILELMRGEQATTNGHLEISHEGSRKMGERVETMALEVHEIHGAIVEKK